MSDQARTITEDIGGELGFRVRWTIKGDHWADLEVYEIVASDEDHSYFFTADGTCEQTTDIADAEKYCHGYIKWDGCSHIDQDDTHLCGAFNFKKRMALLRYIYIRAGELMNRPNGELNEPWGAWDELPVMRPKNEITTKP